MLNVASIIVAKIVLLLLLLAAKGHVEMISVAEQTCSSQFAVCVRVSSLLLIVFKFNWQYRIRILSISVLASFVCNVG